MKVPQCPHCHKLMASVVVKTIEYSTGNNGSAIAWLCPETASDKVPEWVEVDVRTSQAPGEPRT